MHSAIRSIRGAFPVVVFCGYLLAFFAAFTMVFMLPIGALGLVFLALMALVPVVATWVVLVAIERPLARAKLVRGVCPACSGRVRECLQEQGPASFECLACVRSFSSKGEDIELPDPSPA